MQQNSLNGNLLTAIFFICIASSCSTSKTIQGKVDKRAAIISSATSPQTNTAPGSIKNQKPVKSKKSEVNIPYTLSTISGKPYLGIGLIIDSATNLSRSFALFELFQHNLVTRDADTLYPVMIDYPFTAPYAITGIFNDKNVKLKIYKNGKKIKEITALNNWKNIYSEVAKVVTDNKDFNISSKFKTVGEGLVDNVDARKIKNCMPGSMELQIPYSKIVDTLRRYATIRYYQSANPYTNNKELYGKYSAYNENKLFFFRSGDIPYNLKDAAKPIVFPLYKSLIPCLTYLSSGKQLANENDYGASLNSYYSALVSANNILASPFERALVREITYREINHAHKLLSSSRVHSASLFQLGSDLNKAYLNSDVAKTEREEYYNNIQKIEELCTKAEDKAKEIRGQKRIGGILAAISYAGALTSTSAYDNTTSDALMSQAETYFTSSMNQASIVRDALTEQYRNIEDKIDAGSFITSDGTQIETGRSFLAGEVYYYLSNHPELVRNTLLSFASDKPKLLNLIQAFYSGQNTDTTLNDIFSHISEIEAKIVNAEVRNIPLTAKVLSTF